MKVTWLLAHYGFGADHEQIAVPANARDKPLTLAEDLHGTDNLVGIYIPEGTDDAYEVGAMKGRIVGAVRLLPEPAGKTPEDYLYHDILQADPREPPRWPFGWPSRIGLMIGALKVQTLRTLVASVHPSATFGSYAVQFQQGPFRLAFEMRQAVNREMVRLFGDPPWADVTEC